MARAAAAQPSPARACHHQGEQCASGQRQHPACDQAGTQPAHHVSRPLRLGVLQVCAAVHQARRDTLELAVDLDRLLGEADEGQRPRVGRFTRLDHAVHHEVQQRLHPRVVGNAAARRARRRWQLGPEVHAVGQRHREAGQQDHGGREGGCVDEDLAPVGGEIGAAPNEHDVDHHRKQQATRWRRRSTGVRTWASIAPRLQDRRTRGSAQV